MHIYDELGVKHLINAYGTVTKIGGSLMAPEVLQAMTQASEAFVDIHELMEKAGTRIAELLGVQGALITSGAASAMTVSVAGCMTGKDEAKIAQLPNTAGMKDEVLILKCHRFRYDQAVLLTGAHFTEVGLSDRTLPEQLAAAVTDKSGPFLYLAEAEHVRGSLPLQQVVALLKPHGIPVIVDAAAEIPPFGNLKRYLEIGADLVIFSGGKDLRGPQSSGLLLGREDLIKACAMNTCPNHSVGRAMKVDKETIVGLVKAVELYCQQDFVAEMASWEAMVERFVKGLSDLPGVNVWRGFPTSPGIQPASIPRAYLELDEEEVGVSVKELHLALLEGNPGIATGMVGETLVLNPQMLKEDEVEIVISRLRRVVLNAKAPSAGNSSNRGELDACHAIIGGNGTGKGQVN